MQVVINHLTRMQPGYVCTAGLELTTGQPVRPMVAGGLTRALLAEEGGCLALRVVLDLGPTQFLGRVPEIEDRQCDPAQFRILDHLDLPAFLARNAAAAKEALADLFGDELQPQGRTRAIPENHGLRSLGCCWARDCQLIIVDRGGGPRLKLHWRDRDDELLTAVADLRFYEPDHRTLRTELIHATNQQLGQSPRTLLAVGLSRPYRPSESDSAMHWLQVNNLLSV
jgi:hypothetical protein